ncbi:MAG: DUF4364 family protein [Clostridia bacterium]|nr:DUF4364 family protein [Clostridia bacterium]
MLPNPHAMLDEQDRKLYTMLALRELGSASHMQLLYFMVENEIMTYFDLSLALHELVNLGHAAKIAHPADSLYEITAAGLETLSFFINRLPYSKVQLIREKAPAWRERFKAEKQFSAKVIQRTGGEYVAELRLVDGASSILALDIPAPEKKLADRFARAWPEKAGEIYQYLMRTLGDAEEKA